MALPFLPKGYAFVVDKNGNYVVDRNGDYVIWFGVFDPETPLGTPFRFNGMGLSVQIIQPAAEA